MADIRKEAGGHRLVDTLPSNGGDVQKNHRPGLGQAHHNTRDGLAQGERELIHPLDLELRNAVIEAFLPLTEHASEIYRRFAYAHVV